MHAANPDIFARKAQHTIVQEAFTADDGAMLTMLAYTTGAISVSGDIEQLKSQSESENNKANVMAKSTDISLIDRLIANGHPVAMLMIQYRAIPVLSNIISDVWYKGNVKCMVDPKSRPNCAKTTAVLSTNYKIKHPIAFLDVASKEIRVGATKSKQNYIEAQLALNMAISLSASGIEMSDICILSGYVAQVNLLNKLQAQQTPPTKFHVECLTIDKSQCQQYSCIIWSVSGTTVGFHKQASRFLVAVSRAKDCLVIFANWSRLEETSHRDLQTILDLKTRFAAIGDSAIADMGKAKLPAFKGKEDRIHYQDDESEAEAGKGRKGQMRVLIIRDIAY